MSDMINTPCIVSLTDLPPACYRIRDFISVQEESFLIKELSLFLTPTGEIEEVEHGATLRSLDLENYPPQSLLELFLMELSARICSLGVTEKPRNNYRLIRYADWGFLPAHRGYNSFPNLILTLKSEAVLEFTHEGQKRETLQERRSLLVSDGAAIREWQHGISDPILLV